MGARRWWYIGVDRGGYPQVLRVLLVKEEGVRPYFFTLKFAYTILKNIPAKLVIKITHIKARYHLLT